MSLSSQPPQETTQNLQAGASLVLGVLSIILALLYFAPAALGSWSILALVVGFLAMLLGLRGLRMAKAQDGLHRKRASLGVATGLLGASLFAGLAFLNPQLGTTQAPSLISQAPKTFEGGGLKLSYPGHWETLEATRMSTCQRTGVECLMVIGLSKSNGTITSLIRVRLPAKPTVEQWDELMWTQLVESANAILDSREVIKVGGYPAVKRIYTMPVTNTQTEPAHILQVNIIKAPYWYQLMGWTPNAEALRQHQAELESIIASIEFLQ